MKHFNCYVCNENIEWVNLQKINTHEEYVKICDNSLNVKPIQPTLKIVLDFGLKEVILYNFILSENNFNQFKEYKNWNDMDKNAFNAYLNEYRGIITNDILCSFKSDFIGEYESKEDFATECAAQVDFIEEWEKVKDYFNIEKYTDELFEDFTDIKHPTKNSIFVFK